MEKWKIIDDIEEIQNQVNEMGFAGSNEKELWTRDLIAEYIVKKLSLCDVSQQRELLIATFKEFDLGYIQGFQDEEWLADKVIEVINCC